MDSGIPIPRPFKAESRFRPILAKPIPESRRDRARKWAEMVALKHKLTHGESAVWFALVRRTWKRGPPPTIRQLSIECEYSQQTVKNSLKILNGPAGLIRISDRGMGFVNTYYVRFPGGEKPVLCTERPYRRDRWWE